MPFRFNQLLRDVDLDPGEVRLLRHQTDLGRGRSLLDVWRHDRPTFEAYQSLQLTAKRAHFARPYWAAFFGTWDGRTVFGGIYVVDTPVALVEAVEVPLTNIVEAHGTVDRYATQLTSHLQDYSGRLYVEWEVVIRVGAAGRSAPMLRIS